MSEINLEDLNIRELIEVCVLSRYQAIDLLCRLLRAEIDRNGTKKQVRTYQKRVREIYREFEDSVRWLGHGDKIAAIGLSSIVNDVVREADDFLLIPKR